MIIHKQYSDMRIIFMKTAVIKTLERRGFLTLHSQFLHPFPQFSHEIYNNYNNNYFSTKTMFSVEGRGSTENFHAWMFADNHWIFDFDFLEIQFLHS